MSENSGQVEMTDPIEQSKGGVYGHVLRRGIHLGLSFVWRDICRFGRFRIGPICLRAGLNNDCR